MVTVGVSGHRELVNVRDISKAVDQALEKILAEYPAVALKVVSPLAEGADRLVAKRAIEGFQAELIVPLPFEPSDYMQDFKTSASKQEFLDLIGLADEIIFLPAQETRAASYYAVGLYVVDQCDVLIAIWDGQPARGVGGTAQIVEEARKIGKPIAWVHVDAQGEQTTQAVEHDFRMVQLKYEGFPGSHLMDTDDQ